ncbi:MAG: AAA family ATPase [Cyanobacteria bacterium P01_F01_bin.4]
MTPVALSKPYSDKPKPHLNLLLSTLQLWVWLLLKPSAWRSYTAQIDVRLRPNFCLAELRPQQRRQPGLRRLLILEYGILPIIVSWAVGLGLWGLGQARPDIAFGMCVGWAASLGTAIVGSLVVSVAASWMASAIGGLVGGLIFGLLGADSLLAFGSGFGANNPGLKTLIEAILPPIVMASFPNGAAAGIALNVAKSDTSYALGQKVGGIVLGVVGSALTLGIWGGSARYVLDLWFVDQQGVSADVWGQLILGILLGGLLGLMVSGYTHRWRRDLILSLLAGISLAYLAGFAYNTPNVLVRGLAIGGGNALLLTVLFALAYNLAAVIAGVQSGAIAGVLGSSSLHTLFISLITGYPLWPTLLLSLVCMAVGLTLPLWLPICLYPFELVWHLLLYRLDERPGRFKRCPLRPDKSALTRSHAAFWDERQRLPFLGLDQYLVRIINRAPLAGQAAMDALSTGHQRWAVRKAQIELDAQQLERCGDVAAIATLHQQLTLGDLDNPTTPLLLSFRRLSEDTQAALNQSSLYNQRLMLSTVIDQIEGHLRELTRSHYPYAPRFRPILQSWRHRVCQHQQLLVQKAELSQEIESPYIVGIPLTQQQDIFVGRQDISAQIERLLKEKRYSSLLLYGQRRMGKTSLLNNLGRLLPNHIVPLFIDLQGPASKSRDHEGFLYNLARGIVHSAKQYRNLALPPLSRETLAADPFTVFDEWLDQIESLLAHRTALLSLDEFEALDQALTSGRFDQDAVLGMLRNLIQHRPKFKVLLSGSHTLDALQRWSSYLKNLQLIHIIYLKAPEARRLIEQPVRDFPVRYDSLATERIINLTRCHPFLIQLLCAEIIALKNEQPSSSRRQVTQADVEAAIPKALTSGSFFFADIEHNHDEVLPLLQRLSAQREGTLYSPTSPQELPWLDHLVKQEILEVVADQYQFQVDLIRRWLARGTSPNGNRADKLSVAHIKDKR